MIYDDWWNTLEILLERSVCSIIQRGNICFKSQGQGQGGNGSGAAQQSFILGGSAPRFNLLPFKIPVLTEKVPLLVYLLLTNGTPFTLLV